MFFMLCNIINIKWFMDSARNILPFCIIRSLIIYRVN